ncbi:MAG: response regulator transcription factor [Candidatus Omnitrophica bacterium]|nr:response regulator transcription factor [Candidatus Omnitrophota bacterium]
MPNKNILIVEDDKNISKLVRYNLEKAGFSCQSTITGEEALDILDTQPVDLIILDIMLPKMDGLETCKQIKQDKRTASIPVVMLTAKGEEVDRIIGFELGADDYIVKPFSPRELVLRVKAILKRGIPEESEKDIFEFKEIVIDKPRHKVKVRNKEVKLTAMEFKLLETLMSRKGRVQSRDQLLEDVWGLSSDVTTRTIDTHIKRLRQKLGKLGKLIETVRGYGYCLNNDE